MQLCSLNGRLHIDLSALADFADIKPSCFSFAQLDVHSSGGAHSKQPLLRACGLHKNKQLRILDACAGTGNDAFILAHFSARLTSCERNPVVYELLADACANEASHLQWEIIQTDAAVFMQESDPDAFDVVYADPMFNQEKRRAAPRKEMRILAFLEQQYDVHDGEDLLAVAAASPISRLVIKRALRASKLNFEQRQLTHSIEAKGCRFDVYQLK